MLWETHIRLANEVLQRLKLSISSVEAQQLRKGIIIPDRWGDYPHHFGKSNTIKKYLLEARGLFLLGDLPNAYFFLGVALHYIQDSYTSLSSRSMYHGAWEQDIEESDLVENLQRTVELSFSDRRNLMEKYSKLLQILSNDIQGKQNTLASATMIGHERPSEGGDPTVDLNMALKASLLVAKSVLGPKKYPKLEKDLKEVLADHEELLKEAEVALADKIIELVKKRDSLKNRKTYSGMSSKIRNWFLNIAIGIRNYQANSKLQDYNRQRHLDKVIREYEKAAEKISNPHVDWYEFEVPEINVGIVEKELLEINEVIEAFRIHESTVRGLIETGRVSCFNVRGKELLKRTEIKNCLG